MQDIDFDGSHWAVITALTGKKYLGYFKESLTDVVEAMEVNKPLKLHQAFEFTNAMMPVRGPNGEQGMNRLSQASPPNNCIAPDDMWVLIGDLQFFEDMEEVNRDRHKGLVEQAMAQSMQARMQASNIVIPQVQIPGGRLPT
jgi:hypothetical protein